MKILHVLDHSIPVPSGYSYRTRAIIEHQRSLGYETEHVTSAKYPLASPRKEVVDGLHFYRVPRANQFTSRLPLLGQIDVVLSLRKRIRGIIHESRPDIIHAHSPCLTGLAAISAARKTGIPVVYEVRTIGRRGGGPPDLQ